MKKLVPKTRSMNWKMPAASNGGNANKSRKAVTNCAHTKNGNRIQVIPGARNWIIVAMKLTEPSKEALILNTMPESQRVCPLKNGWNPIPESAIPARGGYEVHPDFAAPPGTKKLTNMKTP